MGSHHGIVPSMLDCNIIVSEFKLQWHYYVYFQTNTLGKSMNSLIPLSYGLNTVSTVLYITHKGWYIIKTMNSNLSITASNCWRWYLHITGPVTWFGHEGTTYVVCLEQELSGWEIKKQNKLRGLSWTSVKWLIW